MLRLLVVLLLCLSRPASPQSRSWSGTWTATGAGRTLSGTWTARAGGSPDSGSGTWTVLDDSGKQLAAGAWSARKREKGWEGVFQARAGNGQPFEGTWSARSPLEASAALTDLLELALNNAITGAWQAGRKSGGWSIRAFRTR